MYSQPGTLREALEVLERSDACVIAGGTDVYPAMAPGRQPAAFLDVTRIAGLAEIKQSPAGVRFGAAVTWSDIARLADLPPAFDALRQAAREVGSLQIQNAGTIAGNICNASPAADGVPVLLALEADLLIVDSFGDPRRVARLREHGLAVFDIGQMRGEKTLLTAMYRIGLVCGQRRRAHVFAQRFQRSLRAIASDVPAERRTRAMYLSPYGRQLFGGTRRMRQ